MQLSYYLHDLHYEIGHANVTLNSIEFIDGVENYDIKFVVFSHAKAKSLFNKDINVTIHKVPFGDMKPNLLKIVWFQIYTFFYAYIFDRNRTKISLGVANLACDISIIHFIHAQWHEKYFDLLKPNGIKKFYKKVLFTYLDLCELYLFKIKKTKVITVSNFLKDFFIEENNYKHEDVVAIHSGFDLSRFKTTGKSQEELKVILARENTEIESLDLARPIFLFVGAFERKGLGILLNQWKSHNSNSQLIVIGMPEGTNKFNLKNTIHIEKTKLINEFYEISDSFVFPTHYEPFGMVLIEAAVKGLDIHTTKRMVGASEIIEGLDSIEIFEDINTFKLPNTLNKLRSNERDERSRHRITSLKKYNWLNCAKEYKKVLNKWSNN